jgi:cell division protein FtsI (penicillin-binding protein 3)
MKNLFLMLWALFTQNNFHKSKSNSNPGILYQRLYIVIIVFAVAFSLVATKLINVSIRDRASLQPSFTHTINTRNEIVDRNGNLLAVDLAIVSLYAIPKLLFDPVYTAAKLCEIFPELKKNELTKLLQSGKSFAWIQRNITPKQQNMVNNLGIPGLEFEKGTKRLYTQGSLFSHLLGYVNTDNEGLAGIEKQFDARLRDPKAGKLKLSLDIRVQNIVHNELRKSIEEFKAKGGVGIVMDANNGEIISMVSLPDFDPHKPNLAKPEHLFNQFSLGVYEIGSIMKGITIAMAIESKAVSLRDVYYVKAPIKAARFVIHDYKPKFSYLSVPEIFMYSSNIGTSMISLEVGGTRQRKFLKQFGFFDNLKIELPEKGQPLYPSEKNWSDISTMTISFGHGIAVTPLHFIRAANALVNGGYIYEPTLLEHKQDEQASPITKVLSEETSNTMRKLMRLTVEHGSGKKANSPGYLVGGKTGSAEKAKSTGYSKSEKLSLFFSAFPINNPRYVVLVILDDPRPNANTPYTGGGWTAAPLTGNIISRIAPLLNVKPIDHNDPEIKSKLWIDYKPEGEATEKSF